MVIALFRHGLTEENEKHAYIGWKDSPLSKTGKRQLAKKQASKQYEQVFSSDLLRAKQTAASLFPNGEIKASACFREIHFGEWEGQTYEQLKNSPIYCKWLEEPFATTPPNGENFAVFAKRVEKGWGLLIEASRSSERIALVAHGGVIRYLLQSYGPFGKGFFDYSVAVESGFILVWNDMEAFRRRERCTLLQEEALLAKETGH